MNLNKKEEEVLIRPLEESDLKNVQLFTDRWIGQDYYSYSELHDVFKKGNQGITKITCFLHVTFFAI